MNDAQIKHMVDRFLGWKLPKDFSPDAGISYKEPPFITYEDGDSPKFADNRPTGTNLFDATQADAMVRYMVEQLPAAPASQNALLLSPEYARLCGIATVAEALASVYPERCVAPPSANHPRDCACGQVILERALRARV